MVVSAVIATHSQHLFSMTVVVHSANEYLKFVMLFFLFQIKHLFKLVTLTSIISFKNA